MNRRRDRGMVTAETALALPSLVLVTVVLLWAVAAASTHLACTDAARSGARAAARGEAVSSVREHVARAVPGASVEVSRDGEQVHVEVSTSIQAPLPAFPTLTATAHATAATEPGVTPVPPTDP
ncbi:TadE family type IV pilus minor pilin [Actinomadura flavalba]|uniref:TadE family type IV pilus minor pilin n=1 Tax=Actinomadura flavalba TaxID=1120938 RepID=UPI000685DE94|nr:TadE family type IV pilus minor pilin [Actinomadura flavalba]